MLTTSQAMISQSLLEDQDYMTTQPGTFSFPPNNNMGSLPFGCNQALKTLFTIIPPSFADPLNESTAPPQKEDITNPLFGGSQLFLPRSSPNWACKGVTMMSMMSSNNKRSGVLGDHHLGVSAINKMKKIKSSRKNVREPRFSFKTMSDVDVLDDGYKWRKYGQKVVKDTQHPRSYYRCTQYNCGVKKRVERLAEDPRMVITTYEGRHVHYPSHDDEEDSQASSQLNGLILW